MHLCWTIRGDQGPDDADQDIGEIATVVEPGFRLTVLLGHQSWVQLYPFVVASNCPLCRYRETYFIDRWDGREGTTLMKSFEREHIEEREDISDSLAALASKQQQSQG